MAVQITMKATVRDQLGKGASGKLRRQGLVPAILYGNREKSLPIYFNINDFLKKTHGEIHENMVFDIEVEGKSGQVEKIKSIIKELQLDPVTDRMVHVNFYEMTADKPIRIEVPIIAVGEARGVKVGGGILEHVRREILIECLPQFIPDSIKVDVTNLEIGGAIHTKDLQLPEGISVLEDQEHVLFTIIHITEAKPAPAPTPEEGAEPAKTGE